MHHNNSIVPVRRTVCIFRIRIGTLIIIITAVNIFIYIVLVFNSTVFDCDKVRLSTVVLTVLITLTSELKIIITVN